MTDDINIKLNTEELDKDIAETELKMEQISRKIINVTKKGFNTLVILGELTGRTIDQTYQLMAQAAFIAAETITAIASAESVTVFGAINAALGLTAAAALFAKSIEIRQQREGVSIQIQGLISLANEWRY